MCNSTLFASSINAYLERVQSPGRVPEVESHDASILFLGRVRLDLSSKTWGQSVIGAEGKLIDKTYRMGWGMVTGN